MHKSIIAIASIALSPLVAALGSARVVNNCHGPVTVWSVGGSIAPGITLAGKGGTYSETFTRDPVSGGKALKITREADGLFTGKAQTIFAYSLDGPTVWYDLSDVFGDAFAGRKLVEASANQNCPAIVWPNGTPLSGSQVKACGSDQDVTLTLCAA